MNVTHIHSGSILFKACGVQRLVHLARAGEPRVWRPWALDHFIQDRLTMSACETMRPHPSHLRYISARSRASSRAEVLDQLRGNEQVDSPSRRPAICRCGKPTYMRGGGLQGWGLSALCLDENCSSATQEETKSLYAARYCDQKAQSKSSNTTRDTRKVPFAERFVEEVPIAADDDSMRIDPADGRAYTKNAILKYYNRWWPTKQLENYWKNMATLK